MSLSKKKPIKIKTQKHSKKSLLTRNQSVKKGGSISQKPSIHKLRGIEEIKADMRREKRESLNKLVLDTAY